MATTDDEIIRLLLEIKTEPDPSVIAQKLDVIKGKIFELEGSYEVLEGATGQYAVAEGGAALAMDKKVAALNQEVLAQRNLNAMLNENVVAQKVTATSVEHTATATGGMGRGVLQASYAFQDFTSVLQGGGGFNRAIGSVQNNIPVLLSGLGMGAGLAGTVSLVTVGIGAALPFIEKYGQALLGWKAPADEATAAIERLGRAQGDARQKRALAGIEKQITTLEDKEDTTGFLSPGEQQDLRKLREAAKNINDQFEMEKQSAERHKKEGVVGDKLTAEGRSNEEAWRKEMAKDKKEGNEDAERVAAEMQELGAEARRDAKRADAKAARDAAKVAKDMERNEAKAAKAADPMAINRAAQQAQQSEALGMVQQNTYGFSAKEQGMIAKHLVGNYEAGLQMAQTFEEAMAQAIQQTKDDIFRGVHAGLQRNANQSQSRIEY